MSSAVTGSPSWVWPDGDASEPLAQVGEVARDCDEPHDLARGGDVEAGLARRAVRAAAEAGDDVAEVPVVHVHAPPPRDRERVEPRRVAVMEVRVDQRGEQVVRGRDRMQVAGEVEVQVLHRDDLCVAAARRAALHAEDRAERGLAQAEHRSAAELAEALRERDRRRRLPLARGRRRDRRDVDELRVGPIGEPVDDGEVDLRLVAPVRLDLVVEEPELVGDVADRAERRGLGDLEAGGHRRRHRSRGQAYSPVGRGLRPLQWLTAAAASSETRVSVWKRSIANGAMSSGVFPLATSSASVHADDRRGLEAVRPPPRRDVEVVDLGLAEDRAVVGREVAEPGPRAEHLRALELRQELDRVSGRVLEERQRAGRLVRRVRLDLGADEELAAVRLRDVHVELRRDEDDVEERLHGLGDERLEDVRRDRQAQADEPPDERRPAGGRAHDLAALDAAAIRLDGRDAVAVALEAGDLRALVDLDAAAIGGAREAPDDRVVADDPAGRVVERADDRVRGALREVELRAELGDSRRVDDARLDPEELVDLGPLLHRDHRAVRVRERQVPVLREHEVEVELVRQALVQPHALAVEGRALGRAVVRADDRRVAPGRARADVRLLEDRDVRDPVALREVVRGREPVRAAADDDDLVPALQLRPRPPHPLREEDLAQCHPEPSKPAIASSTASAT